MIVAHHPVSDDDTVWLNARRIPNHHVVFSAKPDQIGLMTRIGGEMVPHVYPAEALLGWVNARAEAGLREAEPSEAEPREAGPQSGEADGR